MIDPIFWEIVPILIVLLVLIYWGVRYLRKPGTQMDSSASAWDRFRKFCKDHQDDFIQLSQLFH
jgi:uncharacterized membrane protein